MNRLTTIANRQRSTRLRDVFFAGCIAIAAVLSMSTLSTACHAATPSVHVVK